VQRHRLSTSCSSNFQSALQNAGLGEDAAKVLASVAGGATATTIGAAASGGSAAGASTAFNADFNNRQQSPKEIKTGSAEGRKTTEEQQRLDDAACADSLFLWYGSKGSNTRRRSRRKIGERTTLRSSNS
jgi:hypothetical protein